MVVLSAGHKSAGDAPTCAVISDVVSVGGNQHKKFS